ncbi:hypothetical protein GCK32_016418, partial [Trichostrongylus colubriformis]
AKALREKLGRNGDGELSVRVANETCSNLTAFHSFLQTINEGLITPVIRRKQFNQPSTLTYNVNDDISFSNDSSSKRSPQTNTNSPSTLVSRGREALEALFVHQQNTSPPNTASGGLARRFNSERGVRGGRESDLVWRRANNQSSSDKKQPSSSSSSSESSSVAASSKRGSCFFPNKAGPTNWSAVNSELKSKQKIAKVCTIHYFFHVISS